MFRSSEAGRGHIQIVQMILPEVGSIKRLIQRKKSGFAEPLRPMTARNSPSVNLKTHIPQCRCFIRIDFREMLNPQHSFLEKKKGEASFESEDFALL